MYCTKLVEILCLINYYHSMITFFIIFVSIIRELVLSREEIFILKGVVLIDISIGYLRIEYILTKNTDKAIRQYQFECTIKVQNLQSNRPLIELNFIILDSPKKIFSYKLLEQILLL